MSNHFIRLDAIEMANLSIVMERLGRRLFTA